MAGKKPLIDSEESADEVVGHITPKARIDADESGDDEVVGHRAGLARVDGDDADDEVEGHSAKIRYF